MEKISLSVFFPCYNEEYNIKKIVDSADDFLPSIACDYEIIVVDDGSEDETANVVRSLLKEKPHVRLISHETNRGYGAALRSGFRNSTKDYIFFTDGDNQFDIRDLTHFLPWIREFDIIAGYRIKRQDNFMRTINAWCFQNFVRLLFGLRIRDLNCAFKLFKREVIENVAMASEGAFINAEILVGAMRKGYTIKEIGVAHYPRKWGTRTGANMKVILKAFYELFKLRKKLR